MRIATNQYQANMLESLALNQVQASKLTQRMASGKRIELPSDDPVDNVRLSRLKREEAAIAQYRDNIGAIKLRLTRNEGILTNMVNDMMPGRDVLVWALDGGNAPDDLLAMVKPLEALRDSLRYNANTKDQEGNYIFSGTLTKTEPIAYDPTAAAGLRYKYAGNTAEQLVVVGNGITQVANENVSGLDALLNQLDVAIETMSAVDATGKPTVDVNDPTVRTIMTDTLKAFDSVMTGVGGLSEKIATMGGIQNVLKTMDDNHANISLSNQGAILDIGELDYAEAATELNGYQNALQATYKAYSKIGNLTLFSEL
jgi:flagellar hook-associated protein 3 FlgL